MKQLFSDGPSIGIYLDDLNIQAVEIEAGKSGGFRVRREASVPMPEGAYYGGKVQAPEPMAQALRNLWERRGSSAVAVLGIAGVVAVFVAVLSIAEGVKATLVSTAAPDRAIVLRSGAEDEMSSILSRDEARVIADARCFDVLRW